MLKDSALLNYLRSYGISKNKETGFELVTTCSESLNDDCVQKRNNVIETSNDYYQTVFTKPNWRYRLITDKNEIGNLMAERKDRRIITEYGSETVFDKIKWTAVLESEDEKFLLFFKDDVVAILN